MSIAVIPVAFFAFLAIVIVVPIWLRSRTRMLALRTISDAIAKGRDADVALIERLLLPTQPAVGKGFALLSLFLGVSGFCVSVGLALAVLVFEAASGADGAGMLVGASVNFGFGVTLTTLGVVSLRLWSGVRRTTPRWDYATILALVTLFFGASGIGVGSGLAFAANTFIAPVMGEAEASGMMIGALVNCCSGIGFTGLGIFILRTFAVYKDS